MQVTLKNITKTYGNNVQAVKPVNLEINQGELIVLVGPSGCGKSTILRMVAGLEDITGGELYIGDRQVNHVDPADRDIAMVFQNYALYPHMSVAQNMGYGLKNRGVTKDEITQKVRDAAEILNLSEFLDRKPSQLSGGQRQRVAMGRAIVRNPSLFLFDEPLSNLDAKLRNQMRIEIKKLQRRLGVTSIYVTHDQVEAMTLADRIVVLNGGVVEQVGTPSEIYNNPASLFVASFMGSPPMNLIDLAKPVTHKNDKNELKLVNKLFGSQDHNNIHIGIRPEKVQYAYDASENSLPFTIDYTEELGASRLMHGKIADQSFILSDTSETEVKSDNIHLSFPAEALYKFDNETGRKIEL
ncbi:sn-glycerol-3-phosphate ABC transporter ATP-binding protein UgpC [Curvivirga sp.]|uniref:sn-glycerol-3-phosphate ABC transporter ATP-binding protein UgpC n=1 Tax=Curvivirga sp. TaxID=2856848 RepID=UPI003B59D4B5